jgi:hypothetical protein
MQSIVQPSAVQQLCENGYCYITYRQSFSAIEAMQKFSALLEKWNDPMLWRQLTLRLEKRPDGVLEADDGFISPESGGMFKELKQLFHYRPSSEAKIVAALRGVGNEAFFNDVFDLLEKCRNVYSVQLLIVIGVLAEIAKNYPELAPLLRDFETNDVSPVLTGRSVLRLLDYPPEAGMEKTSAHCDRALITFHAGDDGGELYAITRGGKEIVVSPKRGEALLFWGEKAEIATRNLKKGLTPLEHGSRGNIGERRRAVVSFFHTNIVLWDAVRRKR